MSVLGKLAKAAKVTDAVLDVVDLVVDVEREDGEGRVDRVTVLGFIPVFDRARGARRRARREARRARRDAP